MKPDIWTLEDKTGNTFTGTLQECLQLAGIETEASYSQRAVTAFAEYLETQQVNPADFFNTPNNKAYKRISSVAKANGWVCVGNYIIKVH